METRKVASFEVSAIGLGCMSLSHAYGPPPPREQAERVLKGALDAGLKVRTLNLPDVFQDHDKPELMYAEAGLNAEHIAAAALVALGVDAARGAVRA